MFQQINLHNRIWRCANRHNRVQKSPGVEKCFTYVAETGGHGVDPRPSVSSDYACGLGVWCAGIGPFHPFWGQPACRDEVTIGQNRGTGAATLVSGTGCFRCERTSLVSLVRGNESFPGLARHFHRRRADRQISTYRRGLSGEPHSGQPVPGSVLRTIRVGRLLQHFADLVAIRYPDQRLAGPALVLGPNPTRASAVG